MTPAEAKIVCASMPTCNGFTYKGICGHGNDCSQQIVFKDTWRFYPSDEGVDQYVSYRKVFYDVPDKPPVPWFVWWSIPPLFGVCFLFIYLSREQRQHRRDRQEKPPFCCGFWECVTACCCPDETQRPEGTREQSFQDM